MSQGELRQIEQKNRIDLTESEYMRVIEEKTACLMAAGCELGAAEGGAGAEARRALGRFGHSIGLAFQITDDLFDYLGAPSVIGKAMGNDLEGGKITLPLIYLLDRCTAQEQAQIAKVMEERAFQSVPWENLLDLIHRYKTPERVKQRARLYSQEALQCLETLPDSPNKRALLALPDLIVDRQN
jgi:octaprenyl-diphosphate synthase